MSTTTTFCALLASIVLTACASENDKLEAENADLQQQNANLQQQNTAEQQRVARLQGAVGYTINSDLLFEPGSWKMKPEGKRIISKMAPKLAPTQENTLVVNGYTDDTPIGSRLEKQGIDSNEELSQKRAEAVRDHLISEGVNPTKVIAVGHGESNPVGDNDTAKGRSQNRRVELTLGG